MALPILTPEDFQDKIYFIPTTHLNEADLESLITEVEKEWLNKFFTANGYLAIKGGTIPEKYQRLIDANDITYDDCWGDPILLISLKDILKGLVYYKWYSMNYSHRITGQVREAVESSERLTGTQVAVNASLKYNEAITIWNENMLPYLEDNEDYEDGEDYRCKRHETILFV